MKLLRATVLAFAVAIPLAAACADPCEDLATICSYCPDLSYKQECQAIADKGNYGVCSADLAIFRAQCPVPPSATATTGAGGGATGGATSTTGGSTTVASTTATTTSAGGN